MKTDTALKKLIYDALVADTALVALVGTRIYWHQPDKQASFPQVVYSVINEETNYTLTGATNANNRIYEVQVDCVVSIGGNNAIGTMVERVKVIMESLDYMMIPGNPETFDDEALIYRVTRWRYYNV